MPFFVGFSVVPHIPLPTPGLCRIPMQFFSCMRVVYFTVGLLCIIPSFFNLTIFVFRRLSRNSGTGNCKDVTPNVGRSLENRLKNFISRPQLETRYQKSRRSADHRCIGNVAPSAIAHTAPPQVDLKIKTKSGECHVENVWDRMQFHTFALNGYDERASFDDETCPSLLFGKHEQPSALDQRHGTQRRRVPA
jgi:hypothetical protein